MLKAGGEGKGREQARRDGRGGSGGKDTGKRREVRRRLGRGRGSDGDAWEKKTCRCGFLL